MASNSNYSFLYDVDENYFVEYIKNSKNKYELFKDKTIKNRIINCENKYVFVWVVQDITDSSIQELLDEEGISLLCDSQDIKTKLNGLLSSPCHEIDNILSNSKMIQKVLENYNFLNSYLSLDVVGSKTAYALLREVDKNDKYTIDIIELLSQFSSKTQIEIVRNFEDIFHRGLSKNDFKYLNKETIQYIVETNELAGNMIFDMNLSEIENLINKGFEIPTEIYQDARFIKKIIGIADVVKYRFFIEDFSDKHNPLYIEEKRNEYYDYLIEHFDFETGLLPHYKKLYDDIKSSPPSYRRKILSDFFDLDNDPCNFSKMYDLNINSKNTTEEIYQSIKKLSDQDLNEITFDRNFKDIYVNVLKNIAEIISFNNEQKIITDEQLKLLAEIYSISELSDNRKIQLYNEMKSKNYAEEFYDIMRVCKNESYEMLKAKIIRHEKDKNLKNEELSNKFGVDVYELNGQDFLGLVHCTSQEKREHNFKWKDGVNSDSISCSFIGTESIETFKNPNIFIAIGFEDFDIDNVVHLSNKDSYSYFDRERYRNSSRRINRIATPEKLMENTSSYNEVVINSRNSWKNDEVNQNIKPLKPAYLLCYDEVTEKDVEISKEAGLYIVLIDTDKYKHNKSKLVDEVYINDYSEYMVWNEAKKSK